MKNTNMFLASNKEMTMDEFCEILEKLPKSTYMVRLKIKYNFDSIFMFYNEILYWDCEIDHYVWLNDWYEGQHTVIIVGFSDVDLLEIPTYHTNIFTRGRYDND